MNDIPGRSILVRMSQIAPSRIVEEFTIEGEGSKSAIHWEAKDVDVWGLTVLCQSDGVAQVNLLPTRCALPNGNRSVQVHVPVLCCQVE